ncbi:TetR/AcrR family transcriptional regulator C-terminal domain-containing protein [Nocardia sp. NPDC088792]|uniref:TetR/AcrR family transcriptional regulator C-terminal domain-containing protein n=1 Tax=Nocardia sp. NPDC088792 TaxID=3364332 RepID=UPI00381D34C2
MVVKRRNRLLSIESICDAALVCIDESGRLTMAELAARLGASPSSVYHHLPGRGAIIEALRERVGATIDSPAVDDPDWMGAISGWMRAYRQAMAAHPNLIPLLIAQPMTSEAGLRSYDRVAGLLAGAGVADADIVPWITALDSFALGSALDLTAPDQPWVVADRADLPALGAAVTAGPAGRRRADTAFELGLAALLAGMSGSAAG